MTETTGPRPDVLAERIEALGTRFSSVERRMENLATKAELVQLLTSRDELMNQRITHLSDDVRDLSSALGQEAIARKDADRANEERAVRARNFALSAIGLVVTVVLGLIALINQLGGAPV